MIKISHGDALDRYGTWPSPDCIVSDGPYGIDGYDGDLKNTNGIASWYEPHIKAWSEYATAKTTLWFWNTEIGWATVHPVIEKYGFAYRGCNIWNKGMAHVAGRTNTKTLRKFPVSTEVCAHYTKASVFKRRDNGETISMQLWLRSEWERAGLTLKDANVACGVRSAASRKYLTKDHLWYFPPPEMFKKLAEYANSHGDKNGAPYFSLDGRTIMSDKDWVEQRSVFKCPPGFTNVWDVPAVRGDERVRAKDKYAHENQKPLLLMSLIIAASTEPGGVVWEPFGGLCSASIAGSRIGRDCYAAEIQKDMFLLAQERVKKES